MISRGFCTAICRPMTLLRYKDTPLELMKLVRSNDRNLPLYNALRCYLQCMIIAYGNDIWEEVIASYSADQEFRTARISKE